MVLLTEVVPILKGTTLCSRIATQPWRVLTAELRYLRRRVESNIEVKEEEHTWRIIPVSKIASNPHL